VAGRAEPEAGHELFALVSNPSTYRILLPRESAEIRVGGKVYLANMPSATAAEPSSHFRVVASFNLSDSSLPNAYQTVMSLNYQDVTVIR
jgi:hypothetical protein